MPRIREYNTQVSASIGLDNPGRRAPLDQPRSDLGAGIMSVGETLFDVAQRQEVSDVQAKLAKARAEWTVHLAERAAAAPSGDPNFASKFNEDFSNYLSTLGDNIQTPAGRQAWQRESSTLASHFVEKAGLYQAQSAGVKARQDYLSLLDNNRNTLLSDPAQFDDVLKFTLDALNDPNGMYAKMPADKREELARATRGEMALSAVQGIIRMNPETAKRQLEGGSWDAYLDADKKFRLERDADIAIRAKEAEAIRLERRAERKRKEEREAVEDGFVSRLMDGELSTKDVVRSNLSPDDKLKWIGLVERSNKVEKITTDSQIFIDFWQRIHLPDGDPRKVVDESEINAFFGKGLTAENVKTLRDEMRGKRSAEGDMESQLKKGAFDTIKTSLTASDPLIRGIRDPKGDEQYQRFLAAALPEWQRQRQAGKSAQALADPDSPDYIGKLAIPLRRTRAQWMRDLLDNNPTEVIGPAAAGVAEQKNYNSADDVRADFKAGLLSRNAATKILRDKGWAE